MLFVNKKITVRIFETGKKIAQPVGLENETYKFLKLKYNERKGKYQNAQDAVRHRLYMCHCQFLIGRLNILLLSIICFLDCVGRMTRLISK